MQFASDEVDEATKITFLTNLTLTYIILKVIRLIPLRYLKLRFNVSIGVCNGFTSSEPQWIVLPLIRDWYRWATSGLDPIKFKSPTGFYFLIGKPGNLTNITAIHLTCHEWLKV